MILNVLIVNMSIQEHRDMEKYIQNGWRVHICTMSCYAAGYSVKEKMLVIYEK